MPNALKLIGLLLIIATIVGLIYQRQTIPTVLSDQDYGGFDDPIEYISKIKQLDPSFFDQKYSELNQKFANPQTIASEVIDQTTQGEIQKIMLLSEARFRILLNSLQLAIDQIIKDNATEFSTATTDNNKLFASVQTATQNIQQIKAKLDEFSQNTQSLNDLTKIKETLAKNQALSIEIKDLLQQTLSLFNQINNESDNTNNGQ